MVYCKQHNDRPEFSSFIFVENNSKDQLQEKKAGEIQWLSGVLGMVFVMWKILD